MNQEPVKLDWLGWFVGISAVAYVVADFTLRPADWVGPAIYLGAMTILVSLLFLPQTRNAAKGKIWLVFVFVVVQGGLNFVKDFRNRPGGLLSVLDGILLVILTGLIWALYRFRTKTQDES